MEPQSLVARSTTVSTNRVKITDTTFRDAHQSLMATRLRIADMEPIASDMDSVGFHSMEVWGGATFDTATRFLAEDPWERLRTFKRLIPNTPLMMLLRGQSLVGYRNYADDVVDAFVQRSADAGIDIFRVFDALNDERNLERSAKAVKDSGKHLQMVVCYSVTEEGRLGGPIYNLDYFVQRAKAFQEMGADSICVKDMAGLLAPYDAFELFTALRRALQVPLQLHTHYTSGMASMTCLKAIEGGADAVDACLAPLALRTAQPAVEPLIMTLRGTDRDPGLDLDVIIKAGDHLESILPKYHEHLKSPRIAVIDPRVLSHQIPGGMSSNLTSQLREVGALDRLAEVLEEIPRTRKELGYPPLVTPTSQIVATQAVSNVLFGRYKMVSEEVKDYVYGLYGRPPASLDPEVVKLVLEGYKRGQTPISQRPGDLIEPELQKAADAIRDISTDMDDVLTYALYPTTGLRFLRIKHGLEPVPDEMKPETETAENSSTAPLSQAAPPAPTKVDTARPKSPRARAFNVYVGGELYRVEVDPLEPAGPATYTADGGGPLSPSRARPEDGAQPATPAAAPGEATVLAPMPGLISRYAVEVGQHVEAGDTVVVLEAMKMENPLPSPAAGSIKALPLAPGATVRKGDVLAIISS
jgi:pyruvate carboxylase subunit B